jgi:hypothetical protein
MQTLSQFLDDKRIRQGSFLSRTTSLNNTKYIVHEQEVPNGKDLSQFFAGGTLRNETYAGGVNFSPTTIPAFKNQLQGVDINVAMMNGNFSFLNPAFASINSLINLVFFDLIAQSHKETDIYTVTLEITDTQTQDIIYSGTSDSSDYDTQTLGKNLTDDFDIEEINTIAKNPIEISPALVSNPLVAMINITTNYSVNESFEVSIGKVAYGTVMGGFRNMAVSKALDVLGLQAMSLAGLTIAGLVTSLFNEVAEIGLGLDNHFGFGGEFAGVDQNGKSVFGRAKSITQGLKEMVPDTIRGLLGLDFTLEDMISKMEQDINNNFGLTNQQGISSLYNYDTFMDATTNLSLSVSIANSQGFAETMAQAQRDAQAMADQLGSFNDTSFSDAMGQIGGGSDGNGGDSMGGLGGNDGNNAANGAGATGGTMA